MTSQKIERVLVVGDGTGPHALGPSYVRAFNRLGVAGHFFDYYGCRDAWLRPELSNAINLPLLMLGRRRAAAALVKRARSLAPDVIFFVKCDDLPSSTYGRLRAHTANPPKLAAFHPDDPFNRRPFRGPSHRRSLVQAKLVDRYFVWSRGLVETLAKRGVNAEFLRFGYDSELLKPAELSADESAHFASDICFIGNWDTKRESWLLPICNSGLKVSIYGAPTWRTKTADLGIQRAYRSAIIAGETYAKALAASTFSLNVLREQNVGAENMRTYEIPGVAGLMLGEDSPQQREVFRHGHEAFYAKDPLALLALARELQAAMTGDELATIKQAAHHAARHHEYVARAAEVIAAFDGNHRRYEGTYRAGN